MSRLSCSACLSFDFCLGSQSTINFLRHSDKIELELEYCCTSNKIELEYCSHSGKMSDKIQSPTVDNCPHFARINDSDKKMKVLPPRELMHPLKKLREEESDYFSHKNAQYWKPIVTTAATFVLGMWIFLSGSNKEPRNGAPTREIASRDVIDSSRFQLLQFVPCFCFLQFLGVLSNMRSQIRFYRWFANAKTSESDRRGLSTKGYPLFGFIPFPVIPSKYFGFGVIGFYGVVLIWTTGLATIGSRSFSDSTLTSVSDSVVIFPLLGPSLLLCLIWSLLYFSSLWAERAASYHRECVCVAVFFYLVLTPDFLDGDSTTQCGVAE